MEQPLEGNPFMRRVAVLLWSAFVGATFSFAALLSLPSSWFDPHTEIGSLSLLFFISWVLALVPAGAAMLLLAPDDDRPPQP